MILGGVIIRRYVILFLLQNEISSFSAYYRLANLQCQSAITFSIISILTFVAFFAGQKSLYSPVAELDEDI
jgi:hypothetical protein